MVNMKARRLRREATEAERILWKALRQIDLPDTHFRRQVPLHGYIVDFACHRAKLVIELDGSQHNADGNIERDAIRTAAIETDGYRVIRFWNADVVTNTESVVEAILAEMSAPSRTPTPSPSPQGGGGQT